MADDACAASIGCCVESPNRKRRTHFMAIIVSTVERSHQPTGKLPVWLVDVEIDGTRRSMHVTAPDTIEARKAVAKRLGIPFSPS